MREGEEGGGGGRLGGHHVTDPCREHGRVWNGGGGGGSGGGGVSCDGIGLLGDEVRDEVGELAVEGDVELLAPPLAGFLLQVRVHGCVLRVVAPPALLLHLD